MQALANVPHSSSASHQASNYHWSWLVAGLHCLHLLLEQVSSLSCLSVRLRSGIFRPHNGVVLATPQSA